MPRRPPKHGHTDACPVCGRQLIVDGWDLTPDDDEMLELECRCGAKLRGKETPDGVPWQLLADEKRDE